MFDIWNTLDWRRKCHEFNISLATAIGAGGGELSTNKAQQTQTRVTSQLSVFFGLFSVRHILWKYKQSSADGCSVLAGSRSSRWIMTTQRKSVTKNSSSKGARPLSWALTHYIPKDRTMAGTILKLLSGLGSFLVHRRRSLF